MNKKNSQNMFDKLIKGFYAWAESPKKGAKLRDIPLAKRIALIIGLIISLIGSIIIIMLGAWIITSTTPIFPDSPFGATNANLIFGIATLISGLLILISTIKIIKEKDWPSYWIDI